MKPLIGITCGTLRDQTWCPPFQGHRQTYIEAVVAAGGAPMLLPLVEDADVLRAIYEPLDGLLLAGGNDLDPRHYGEEPHPELGTVDVLRDRVELQLARWAAAEGKPVLGICRGMQVLNVALGGTLYQDIGMQLGEQIMHDSSYKYQDWTHMVHDLEIDPQSRLAGVFGETLFPINSLHHQSLKIVAPSLRPVGWSPDGVVELVESDADNYMVGVQCHPEALQGAADLRWRRLFGDFVNVSRRAMTAG